MLSNERVPETLLGDASETAVCEEQPGGASMRVHNVSAGGWRGCTRAGAACLAQRGSALTRCAFDVTCGAAGGRGRDQVQPARHEGKRRRVRGLADHDNAAVRVGRLRLGLRARKGGKVKQCSAG